MNEVPHAPPGEKKHMITFQRQPTLIFYIHALAGGGAERVMARLASSYARRGARALLVMDHEASEWASILDERVERILLPKGHFRGALALSRLLFRVSPDISISALSANNLKHVLAATLAGTLRRAVITFHGFAENEPKKLAQFSYWLTPVLTSLAARNVAVSDALKEDLIRRFHASPDRLETIHNPASPEHAHPPVSPQNLANREAIVVAVGRLVVDKGFLFLVRAFAKVTYPGAKLIVLGKGPDLPRLRSEAERLGVAERVEFAGYVAEIDSYLSRARCFVSPSYHESFGLAIVEALDFGLAVVSTDSGGPREILNSPAVGKIVPLGDEAAMATAISESLAAPGDPSVRQRRSRDFTLEIALRRYDKIFEEISPSLALQLRSPGTPPIDGGFRAGGESLENINSSKIAK